MNNDFKQLTFLSSQYLKSKTNWIKKQLGNKCSFVAFSKNNDTYHLKVNLIKDNKKFKLEYSIGENVKPIDLSETDFFNLLTQIQNDYETL